jgi:3-isopropylmalate/(R)-2-methylmalate dehydratase small subunit
MEKFTTLRSVACPLGLENVDTDQLIPARFMSRPRNAGYGSYLLHDLRFAADGSKRQCIIDDPICAGAKILIARRNFGTGSSREAAVYALWDFGIRCVIAPSFGDIFASNAVKNGLLPAQVSEADAEQLLAACSADPATIFTVDLEVLTIHAGSLAAGFVIDPVRRLQLLNGWDDLDLTLLHRDAIDRFRRLHHQERPWAVPARVAPARNFVA